MVYDSEDKELPKVINRALYKAVQSFYKELEKAGYDGAYFGLKIQIFEYTNDFNAIISVLSWDNLGSSVTRHEILKMAKTILPEEVRNEGDKVQGLG